MCRMDIYITWIRTIWIPAGEEKTQLAGEWVGVHWPKYYDGVYKCGSESFRVNGHHLDYIIVQYDIASEELVVVVAGSSPRRVQGAAHMASNWVILLTVCMMAALLASSTGLPVSDEDEATNEIVPLEILLKRASNLGGRLLDSRNCGAFNMGKKFGGYSWLRSADSTMRRLQYYFGNKWQQHVDQDMEQVPALQKEVYWDNN